MTDRQPEPAPRRDPPEQQRQNQDGKSPSSTSSSSSSLTGYRFIPYRIPAPLQRLFDRFPLVAYPANELPARCPRPSDRALPTLHVFISEEDAAHGRPSFNPSCLKWQTFLKIAGVELRVVPSTNHASPSGALPFLLPPAASSPSSTSTAPVATRAASPPSAGPTSEDPPTTSVHTTFASGSPTPVPANKLQAYALAHGSSPPSSSPALVPPSLASKVEAHTSLLDGPIRRAWLHSLYLNPANVRLLTRLYLRPATASPIAQGSLHHQLRAAATAELASSHNGVDPPSAGVLYADARRAFEGLSELLVQKTGEGRLGREGVEQAPRNWNWFFGGSPDGGPTLFDAAVFSYTHLLLEGSGLEWADRSLVEMVEALPPLVAHRSRLLERLWGEEAAGDSLSWEKV